jgi:lipoyl(octanoyl) transferase
MTMTPFTYINPCGFQGLAVTQMRALGVFPPIADIEHQLALNFLRLLRDHYKVKCI